MTFRWAEPQKNMLDPMPKDKLRNRFAMPTENSLTCEVGQAELQDLGTFEVDLKALTIDRVMP